MDVASAPPDAPCDIFGKVEGEGRWQDRQKQLTTIEHGVERAQVFQLRCRRERAALRRSTLEARDDSVTGTMHHRADSTAHIASTQNTNDRSGQLRLLLSW